MVVRLFPAVWVSICGNMLIFLSEIEFDGGMSPDNTPIGCLLDAAVQWSIAATTRATTVFNFMHNISEITRLKG